MPARPPAPHLSSAEQKLARYVIPNLRNACRILKLLGRKPDGCIAADLARELHLPVTTTLRIMATLQLEGLARKVEHRFELGPALISLGNASLEGTEIREMALPVLEKLTAQTDETSHLAIPCDDRSLIIAVQSGSHPLRAASRPGYLADLHCSSTGKVFLAFIPSYQLSGLFAHDAARRTPQTKTTLAEIKREIEVTRKRGYGLETEEFHPGVRCLAAPVIASTGAVVAAVGITASMTRFTRERVPEIAGLVAAAASELSHQLGHVG